MYDPQENLSRAKATQVIIPAVICNVMHIKKLQLCLYDLTKYTLSKFSDVILSQDGYYHITKVLSFVHGE